MMIELVFICPWCGEEHTVSVPFEEWLAYSDGELAQNAFKSLNATEREQIISHTCPDCQKQIFGEDDEDEDEGDDIYACELESLGTNWW